MGYADRRLARARTQKVVRGKPPPSPGGAGRTAATAGTNGGDGERYCAGALFHTSSAGLTRRAPRLDGEGTRRADSQGRARVITLGIFTARTPSDGGIRTRRAHARHALRGTERAPPPNLGRRSAAAVRPRRRSSTYGGSRRLGRGWTGWGRMASRRRPPPCYDIVDDCERGEGSPDGRDSAPTTTQTE